MILKRMKRRHSRDEAIAFCNDVRRLRPDMVFGADIIAGFPTETEEMFAMSLDLVEACGLTHLHVFPFSPRPGTPAARMPQVDPATIKARAAELRAAVANARTLWLATLIGEPLEVLAERDGTGHAPNFARVQLPPGTEAGTIVTVTPMRIIEGLLA